MTFESKCEHSIHGDIVYDIELVPTWIFDESDFFNFIFDLKLICFQSDLLFNKTFNK